MVTSTLIESKNIEAEIDRAFWIFCLKNQVAKFESNVYYFIQNFNPMKFSPCQKLPIEKRLIEMNSKTHYKMTLMPLL